MRYCRPDMDIKWVVTIIAILVTTHCCNLQSSVSFSNFNFLLFNHIYHHCGLGRGSSLGRIAAAPCLCHGNPGHTREDMTMVLRHTGCVCLQDCSVPASSPAPVAGKRSTTCDCVSTQHQCYHSTIATSHHHQHTLHN